VSMLDRIEVDVIGMALVIQLVDSRCLHEEAPREAGSSVTSEVKRETERLISDQRVEKSQSPSGRVQMQCRWSGSRTQASIEKGRVVRRFSIAIRRDRRTAPVQRMGRRS
jgi:hypothetical protein